jgi:hypothetical protein
MGYMLT